MLENIQHEEHDANKAQIIGDLGKTIENLDASDEMKQKLASVLSKVDKTLEGKETVGVHTVISEFVKLLNPEEKEAFSKGIVSIFMKYCGPKKINSGSTPIDGEPVDLSIVKE